METVSARSERAGIVGAGLAGADLKFHARTDGLVNGSSPPPAPPPNCKLFGDSRSQLTFASASVDFGRSRLR